MRSRLLIAVVAGLLLAPPAGSARTVVQSDTAWQARLLPGGGLAWREGAELVHRDRRGEVRRTALPRAQLRDLLGVSRRHVLVARDRTYCFPAAPGELTTSCLQLPEILGGPAGAELKILATTPVCARFRPPAAVLEGATAAFVEDRSACRADGWPEPQSAVVTVDLRSGARRTLASYASPPTAIRAAGDWIAWSRSALGHDEIVLWRDGAVRRRLVEEQLGSDFISAWDLQADGTIVVAGLARAEGRPLRVHVARPHRPPRPIGMRINPNEPSLQVARDRIVSLSPRGRLLVTDLAGRPRGVARARVPGWTLPQFDGRRGVWIRQKVLDPGVDCATGLPAPHAGDCTPRPERIRQWVVSDLIAR